MSHISKACVAAPPSRVGIGLRPRHHQRVRNERPSVAWFEVHAENFMAGGMLAEDLDDIALDFQFRCTRSACRSAAQRTSTKIMSKRSSV